MTDWLADARRDSPWRELSVVVAGLGRAGFAAADALAFRGARVVVVDDGDGARQRERAELLDVLGVAVHLSFRHDLPEGADLFVVSPGLPRGHRLVQQATDGRVPVWSGEQLAWHLRPDGQEWLTLTGTNGKTTTVTMLESILRADGRNVAVAGNIGRPLIEAATADPGYAVLAVELSSFQLHFTHGVHAHSSALLNLADDHLDWHGSAQGYRRDKARVFDGTVHSVVYNVQDAARETFAREAEVTDGCRGIGFSLATPDVGMLGLVDDVLVDRAFVADRRTHALELATLADVHPAGRHSVANALAAAALARSYGVTPVSVRRGLRDYRPPRHRLEEVATVAGVRYVDDSKATNPHAAAVALHAFEDVVWVAGGLSKGTDLSPLVAEHVDRLLGVVVVGTDRSALREALARHAPQVPVIEVGEGETDVMEAAVRDAAGLARPGATVLLSPACASQDQFHDYAARGDAFAAAVRRLAARSGE